VGGDIKHKMDLIIIHLKFFDRYRVNVIVNCSAISIDRAYKIVYAKLVIRILNLIMIACSSNWHRNILPPIEGIDRTLYFHMRSIEDGEKYINL